MESWFLVPRFERTLIQKSTNKLYTNHNIAKSNYYPVVVTLSKDNLVDDKIPIKKIRSKSVVLSKPLRKGELVTIGYEYWVYGRVEERDGNISVFIEGYGD